MLAPETDSFFREIEVATEAVLPVRALRKSLLENLPKPICEETVDMREAEGAYSLGRVENPPLLNAPRRISLSA